MHLHELLHMSIDDYETERGRIERLFFHTPIGEGNILDRVFFPSLAAFIEDDFSRSIVRGTATDIHDFFNTYSHYWGYPSLEGLLLYCEILWNILASCEQKINTLHSSSALANQISQNIIIIIDKTGHEICQRQDKLYEIVKKDALASATIADLPDRDAAFAVLDYLHFGIKGNVARKRELLVTIGRYVEPLLNNAELKRLQKDLLDDVGFCLNNLHIRHNNEEGKNAKSFVESMPPAEMEEWYDKAYRSMLLIIEHHKHLQTHSEIVILRKQANCAEQGVEA